jgi:hypothetical protein
MTAAQLAADPAALGAIVDDYAQVSAVLAAHDDRLASGIRELARTLAQAPDRLRRIDAALPALRAFARALDPTLAAAPPALRALTRAATEVRGLTGARALPRLLTRLHPLLAETPRFERRLTAVLPQASAIGRCMTKTLVPALNTHIDDGALSTHRPVWQDALHMGSALAGAASAFDANGGTLRLGVSESEQAVGINFGDSLGTVAGLLPTGQTGLNPTWLGFGVQPPWRPDAPCDEQQVPDFSARRQPGMPHGFRRLGRAAVTPAQPRTLRRLLDQLTPEKLLRQVAP